MATSHREAGKTNSKELYKIIERIAPEVIFEEVPPGKFVKVYKGLLRDSMETTTIKRYYQKHSIDHIPVDLEIDELTEIGFRSEFGKMADIFRDFSPQYNDLSYRLGLWSELQGFPYLNSQECADLFKMKHFLEEEILNRLNLEKLTQAYSSWLDFVDRREQEMIKNIYNYSALNKYKRALFLVGAEHRKAVMNKIAIFEEYSNQKLTWKFNYFN